MNYKDLQNISYLSQQILTESASEEHNVMNRWPYTSPYLQEERAPGVKPYKPGSTQSEIRADARRARRTQSERDKDKSGYGPDEKFTDWKTTATPSTVDRKGRTVSQRMNDEKPYVKRMTGPMAREYGSRAAAEVTRVVKGAGEPQAVTYPRQGREEEKPKAKARLSREIVRKTKKEDFELWVNNLLDEGYDLSGYTWDELYENYQQLNEISDRKVQGMVNARNRQDRQSDGGAGSPTGEFWRAKRANQAAARRNVRTGSNVKVNPDLAKESYDIYDVILSHLLDEGYAETQEAAEAIMVNMSEDWREDIIEDIRGAITYNPNTPIGRITKRIKGSTPEKREARTRAYQGNRSDAAERYGASQRNPYDDNRGDIPSLRGR